jgi:putative transposase
MRTLSCFFWSFFDRIRGMKLYKSAHSIYKTQYHIVWITRYRRKILVTGVNSYLEIKLQEITKYYPDWGYLEIGIKPDHVHLYMVIPPKYAVSKTVEVIKKNTSRSLSRKFTFLQKVYWDQKGIWGRGYFVSTVGINEEVIRKYVQSQAEEETGQAQLEF